MNTHGVTQYSANLEYQNESGALNESFSDIFGVMIHCTQPIHCNGLLVKNLTVLLEICQILIALKIRIRT